MILTYFLRLLALSLASFFLVHLVLSLIVSLAAARVVQVVDGMRPRMAANWLLAVRVFPAAAAMVAVAGLLIPSYLRFEPDAALERVGWAALGAALLGISILANSIARALGAIIRSWLYARHSERIGRPMRLAGERLPVWVTDAPASLFALVGILRPRLVVSQRALRELSADQLTAVLRHERGHRDAHDNLRRLLVLLSPDLFPLGPRLSGTRLLDRQRIKQMEWAADDRAVGGNPACALSLAEALLRTARISAAGPTPLLVSSFIVDGPDYSARVERLLSAQAPGAEGGGSHVALSAAVAAVLISWLTAGPMLPALLAAVHGLIEVLIR